MADTDVLVSELDSASAINTNDLLLMTQPDGDAQTGYASRKGTVLQTATKMLKGIEFTTDLPHFTDKTPLGGLEELKADIKALLPISSASGDPCNFETAIADKLVSLLANITASGGGGTPSTPIPIVGHSELNLTRCGKNFVPKGVSSSRNGITFTVQDNGEVIVTGTATATAFWAVQFYIPSGSYILNGCPSGGSGCSIDVRNAPGGSGIPGISGDSGNGSSFTRTEELSAWLNIRVPNGYSAPSGGLKFSPMIRLASETSSEYEPYNGQTFTVAFGQTVYGGVLDVTRGKLTVTWSNAVDLGSLGWSYDSNQQLFVTTNFLGYKNGTPFLCDIYTDKGAVSVTQITNYCGTLRPNALYIKNEDYTVASTFRTAMSGKYITAELATPIEIDVSELSVDTIVGVNNIVSDCGGDIAVEYRDSIQHYIDKKIAETQALIL